MRKNLTIIAHAIIALFVGANALAQNFNNNLLFSAKLDGTQQNPALNIKGIGIVGVTLNATHDTLFYNASANGLTGPIIAAHFHEGPPGVNGPVKFDLTKSITGNRIVGFITGKSILTDTIIAKFLTGSYYLNIHTQAHSGGEIRGQLYLEKDWAFTSVLNGAKQVPTNPSLAYGVGMTKLSKDSSSLKLFAVVEGLPDNDKVTGAHLHIGGSTTSGPIALTLQVSENTISTEINPKTYSGDIGYDFPSFWTSLFAGNVYLNVHTTKFAGGEIRGQLMLDNNLTFDAKATGAEEVPSVATPGIGVGSFRISPMMDTLYYDAVTTGLSGPVQQAHLHLGALGKNGDVIVPLSVVADNRISGAFTNKAILNAQFVSNLLSGNFYFNVHTQAHLAAGEIRGQVNRFARLGYTMSFDGGQQVPAVASKGTGAGIVSIDRDLTNLYYGVVVSGLKSKIISAHFHQGLAGQAGDILYTLTNSFSRIDTIDHAFAFLKNTDAVPFTVANAIKFTKDSIYLNIHNDNFPNGEIRGQVLSNPKSSFVTSIQDASLNMISGFSLSPNPASDKVNVSVNASSFSGLGKIAILDMMGKEIMSQSVNFNSGINLYEVNMQELNNGTYMLQIENGDNKIVKRVVKN